MSGLHSVQGEGLVFTHRVEKHDGSVISSREQTGEPKTFRRQGDAQRPVAQVVDPEFRSNAGADSEGFWLATAYGAGGTFDFA